MSFAQGTSLPSPSEVAPSPEQAKKHFQNAKIFYELGQFDDAVYEYNMAYMCEQRPEFLYNLAQTYRRQGEVKGSLEALKMARFHFELFLKKEPKSPYKRDVESLMKDLDKEIKRVEDQLAEAEEGRKFRVRDEKKLQEIAMGKATNETLQLILGLDYTPFLRSGLTLDGYLETKRGKRNTRLGSILTASGLAIGVTGAIFRFGASFEDKPALRFLGTSGVVIGGISFASGSFLLPYGLLQQRSGKLEKRAKLSEPASQPAN
jgi:tetratricopeptide (TPR) repeat protein